MASNDKESAIVDGAEYESNGNNQYVDPATGIETKTGRMMEAREIYGNEADAEAFGYVARGYVESQLIE